MESEMKSQSPIDIVDSSETYKLVELDASQLSLTLGTAEAEYEYRGANFQINWADEDQNFLVLNGKKYYTVQFHFHAPSEHTVNGDAHAMELHLVHKSEDDELAVVGLFFKTGAENAFLAQFWNKLPELKANGKNSASIGSIHASDLEPLAGEFYRYAGSLTTPPYSEGVQWVVAKDAVEASEEQLELYRSFIPEPNARACQALNGRSVSLHACSPSAP